MNLPMSLKITCARDVSTHMTLTMAGRLDAITAPLLDKEINSLPEDIASLDLDFSRLEYISSRGLRSILLAKKMADKRDVKMRIISPTDVVQEVFRTTHFDNIVEIVYPQQDDNTAATNFDGFYPLRPIQRWLVDNHFHKANSTIMNIGTLMKLDDSIDMEQLSDAINSTLEAYDVFRCRLVFHPETGEICQKFDGELIKTRVEALSEEAFEKRKRGLKEPYQIIDSPLYRIYPMITPSGKYLYMDCYHVLMDGTAASLLLVREIDRRYRGKNPNRKPPGYAEYILEEAAKSKSEEGIAYWQEMLKGFDEKKHLPPIDRHGGEIGFDSLAGELPNVSRNFLKGKPFSEHTFLLGASMLAMARLTGAGEAMMSFVHNGRQTPKEMRIMGLMLNQYPIAWNFQENCSVAAFLQGLEAKVNEGFRHTDSLASVYDQGLEDSCASFILQKGDMMANISSSFSFCGAAAEIVDMPVNKGSAAENTLDIHVVAGSSDHYRFKLEYDSGLYSRKLIEDYAALLGKFITELQNTEKMVSELLQ